MKYNIGDMFIIKVKDIQGSQYMIDGIDWYFPERILDKLQNFAPANTSYYYEAVKGGDPQGVAYYKGYEEGAKAAWEVARKIVGDPTGGGISIEDLRAVFGTLSYSKILFEYTAYEAIEKVHEWEKKKKEDEKIKVGDECVIKQTDTDFPVSTDRFVVTRIFEDEDGDKFFDAVYVTGDNGAEIGSTIYEGSLKLIKRTGIRHTEIAKLFGGE